MTSLNELAEEIHGINKDKGFWDKPRDALAVLMLIVSEAAEACEDIRSGFLINEIQYESISGKPIGVPTEMADIIIRVLDACAAWGIDIESAIREKVEYNKTRAFMHGRTA